MSDYGLVMPFRNDTLDFTLGYECGVIAQKMELGATLTDYTIHSDNIAQVEIIAKRFHYHVEFKALGEGWATMQGQRVSAN